MSEFSGSQLDRESWVPSLGIAVDGHCSSVDPFRVVAPDLETMTRSVRETVSVLQHPVLDRAASHLFSLHGKRIRPVIVILMGHATANLKNETTDALIAGPRERMEVRTENTRRGSHRLSLPHNLLPGPLGGAAHAVGAVAQMISNVLPSQEALGEVEENTSVQSTALLESQLRLAEITEMIHAASLLHDDVIDTSDSRRGVASVNSMFGNHLAVLAGDFLLARASVALARLRDCDVVELLSTVIEHLVRGEVIQMNGGEKGASALYNGSRGAGFGGIGDASEEDVKRQKQYHEPNGIFETYMAKTFFKTASLMANSCRAVTMLAGHSQASADAAYAYGEHLGIAFQLVDDMLDFTSTSSALGKPVLNDLQQGHATAPVLFALDSFPERLGAMIERRFGQSGDVEAALDMVHEVDGIEQTRALAAHHARSAVVSLSEALPPSDARSALINIAEHVLTRSK